MVLRRLTLALVALGLVGSPLSTLFCARTDPAAMACCQNNPQRCNKTGMSDGCCRTVPNDGNASGPLVNAVHAGAPIHAIALVPVSASILIDLTAPAGRHPLVAARHLPLDLPPPLLSTLRI